MRTIHPISILLPLCVVLLGVSCSDRHGPFEPDEYTSAVNIRLEFPGEGAGKPASGDMTPTYGILTMHSVSSQACESETQMRFSGNTASGAVKISHRGIITKHFRVFVYNQRWIPIYTGSAMNVAITQDPEISVTIALKQVGMVPIPGGMFQRGSVSGDQDEQPIRAVYVDGFEMSATEVTVTQFQELLRDVVHPLYADQLVKDRKMLGDRQPTYLLDPTTPMDFTPGAWSYIPAYCNQLSLSMGYQPCYTDPKNNFSSWIVDMEANGFRLPTEMEWEYACQAGTMSEYATADGSGVLERVGWCVTNSSGRPHSVASQQPNAWGLYDMHGNMAELCQDTYSETFYQTSGPINPLNSSRYPNVLRGGSWSSDPTDCRASNRQIWSYNDGNSSKMLNFGFRIVRRP
jgi:formylglycine-generating enzyme required for sulfatase activity